MDDIEPIPRRRPVVDESSVDEEGLLGKNDSFPEFTPWELDGLEQLANPEPCPWWILVGDRQSERRKPSDSDERPVVDAVRHAIRFTGWIEDEAIRRTQMIGRATGRLILVSPILAAGAASLFHPRLATMVTAFVAPVALWIPYHRLFVLRSWEPRTYTLLSLILVVGPSMGLVNTRVVWPIWRAIGVGVHLALLTLLGILLLATVARYLIVERREQRSNREAPEEALYARLVKAGRWFEHGDTAANHSFISSRAVETLEEAAIEFEMAWCNDRRTGVSAVDRQVRQWASRVAAEVRELQIMVAIGGVSNEVVLYRIFSIIESVFDRDPLNDHARNFRWMRDDTLENPRAARTWPLRLRRWGRTASAMAVSLLLGTCGSAVLAAAIWPGISQALTNNDWPWLGSLLAFDPDVRVFVAGLGLSMLAIAGRQWNKGLSG